MKKLPEGWSQSRYKYNIIARLILLEGGEAALKQNKRELVLYLAQLGARKATVRKWLIIERGVKQEIPVSVLVAIKDFFNQKYENRYQQVALWSKPPFEPISLEDLYFEGQLKILPNP